MSDLHRLRFVWRLAPIIDPVGPHNLFEHTPLDYYRYGEYPRFIRPIGAHQPSAAQVRATET